MKNACEGNDGYFGWLSSSLNIFVNNIANTIDIHDWWVFCLVLRDSWCGLVLRQRGLSQCRGVITHFTSRDIWNRYPIPDPSQYIFLKHNTRPAFPSLFPLSQNTSFCLQQLNTTRQSKYRRDHMCFFFWTRIRRQKQEGGWFFFLRKEVDWISVSLAFNHLIWSPTFDNLSLQATFILGYIYFPRKGN